MSDIEKTIDTLNLHEEAIIQEDDLTLTVVFKVPGGLIYKFFENDSGFFHIKATEFVPYYTKQENSMLLKS